jgi:hypothetical protein
MSRDKGRTDPKGIEKTYPHIVEMIVPSGGFAKKLDTSGIALGAFRIIADEAGATKMVETTSVGALLIPHQRKHLDVSWAPSEVCFPTAWPITAPWVAAVLTQFRSWNSNAERFHVNLFACSIRRIFVIRGCDLVKCHQV